MGREGLVVDVCVGCCSRKEGATGEISSLTESPARRPIKRRKSSKQATEARIDAKAQREDCDQRFKCAFKEGTEILSLRMASNNTSGFGSVDKIVANLNQKFDLKHGKKRLNKSSLYRAVRNGRVGKSPVKRGPPPKVPDILLDTMACHTEVSQVGEGGDLNGRDIQRLLTAAVLDTKYDGSFTTAYAWKKLRLRHPERLQASMKVTMEEARSKWTTVSNLEQWFTDAKADLISSGLVIDSEVRDVDGNLLSEVDFRSDEVRRRIINMDETHHDLSITGDKGGSRAIVYSNPNLQRGYRKTVKAGRHVTGCYATNSAGEALPPLYIFDSGAKVEANYRVKLSWLNGLPEVTGRYGCPERVTQASFYSVRARGSMDDSLFNDYVERVVLPLYPNISKTAKFDGTGKLLCGPVILKVDSGPGRIVANLESIKRRDAFRELGLLILMGLPNATSVNQEMDALYGAFKSATYARGEVILTERLKLRGLQNTAAAIAATAAANEGDADLSADDAPADASPLTSLAMGFEDLSTVVNGNITDDIDMKPFSRSFTKEKILGSWSKVGFVPFTRNCVKSKKVRHELGQATKDQSLEDIHTEYQSLVTSSDKEGLNAGIFDGKIPVAKHVEREKEEADQVKKLLATKGSFSTSALWNICGTRIGNASVVLRAQTEQLAREATKVSLQAQTKSARRARLLLIAQQALQKYESAPTTMTDKDWIDIIRWVLPESNADGLLKDLQKKDAIMQKLLSLDKDWKAYIPNVDTV